MRALNIDETVKSREGGRRRISLFLQILFEGVLNLQKLGRGAWGPQTPPCAVGSFFLMSKNEKSRIVTEMKKKKPQITQITQIFLYFLICVNLCNLWTIFIAALFISKARGTALGGLSSPNILTPCAPCPIFHFSISTFNKRRLQWAVKNPYNYNHNYSF